MTAPDPYTSPPTPAPRSTGSKIAIGAGIGCGGLTAFGVLCVVLALVFGTAPKGEASKPAVTPVTTPPPVPATSNPPTQPPSPTPTVAPPATSAPAPVPTTATPAAPTTSPPPPAPLYVVTNWDEPRRQMDIEITDGTAAREAFDRAITDKITATSGKSWYVRVGCATGKTGDRLRTISSGYYLPGTPADADHHTVHRGSAGYLAPGPVPCPA